MLNSAILLWMVHKYSEIWQIPLFYEILRDKIQDKEIYLSSFLEKKHTNSFSWWYSRFF